LPLVPLIIGLAVVGAPRAEAQLPPPSTAEFEVLANRYLQMRQNRTSLVWTIRRLLGDPLTPLDNDLGVMPDETITGVQATILINDNDAAEGFTQNIYGDTGGTVTLGASRALDERTLVSEWRATQDATETDPGHDIIVTQRLSLVRDMVRVEYVFENVGPSRIVSLRLAVDPDVAGDDNETLPNPPLYMLKEGFISNEHDYRKNFSAPLRPGYGIIPDSWFVFGTGQSVFGNDDPNAFLYMNGQMRGLDVTTPDRVVAASLLGLLTGDDTLTGAGKRPLPGDLLGRFLVTNLNIFDYTIRPGQFILNPLTVTADGSSDPWVAQWWGYSDAVPATSLGTGQTVRYVMYIGVGVADHGLAPDFNAPRNDSLANPIFVAAAQSRVPDLRLPDSEDIQPLPSFHYVPLLEQAETVGTPRGFLAAEIEFFGAAQNLRNDLVVEGVTEILALPEGLEINTAAPDPAAQTTPVVDLPDLQAYIPNAPPTPDPGLSEQSAFWRLIANGDVAGVLPVMLTVTSALSTATVRHEISVPQGTTVKLRTEGTMMTFPYRFADPSPEAVFGIPAVDFQIVRWNPALAVYEPVFTIVPGESYWVRLLGAADVRVQLQGVTAPNGVGPGIPPPVGLPPPAGSTVTSLLAPGWNQVGNVSPWAVLLKNLQFRDNLNGTVVNYDNAVLRGIIPNNVWRFDKNTRTYVRVLRDDWISPGEGIWIFSPRPVTVLWPTPQGFGIGVLPPEPPIP
jgi:hypothetical protein